MKIDEISEEIKNEIHFSKFELPEKHGDKFYFYYEKGGEDSELQLYKIENGFRFNSENPKDGSTLIFDLGSLAPKNETIVLSDFRWSLNG